MPVLLTRKNIIDNIIILTKTQSPSLLHKNSKFLRMLYSITTHFDIHQYLLHGYFAFDMDTPGYTKAYNRSPWRSFISGFLCLLLNPLYIFLEAAYLSFILVPPFIWHSIEQIKFINRPCICSRKRYCILRWLNIK